MGTKPSPKKQGIALLTMSAFTLWALTSCPEVTNPGPLSTTADFTAEVYPPVIDASLGASAQSNIILNRTTDLGVVQVKATSANPGVLVQPFSIPANTETGVLVLQTSETAPVGQEVPVMLEVSNASGSRSLKLIVRIQAKAATSNAVIPAKTKVADVAARLQVLNASIDDSSVRFAQVTPYTQSLNPGDVIVSEPSQNAPYGFLRKVESVMQDGTQVLVRTKAATLAESIDVADLSEERTLTGADTKGFTPLAEGVSLAPASRFGTRDVASKKFSLDFDRVVIDLSKDDKDPNTNGTLKISGSLSLGIGLIFEFKKGSGLSVKRFKTGLHVTQSASLKIVGDVNVTKSKQIEIGEIRFGSVKFNIGIVPVVLTPLVKVSLDFKGRAVADLNFEIKESEDLQMGIKYERGPGWGTFFDHQSGLEVTGPRNVLQVSVTGRASATVTAGIKAFAGWETFFGDVEVASGFFGVYVSTFAELNFVVPRNQIWAIDVGLELGVRVEASIVGIEITQKNFPLANFNFTTVKAPNNKPTLTLIDPGSAVTAKIPKQLVKAVFDPEDGDLACTSVTWTSSIPGDGSGNNCTAVTFASQGNRTMSWTARDSAGLTTTVAQALNVLPTPPLVILTPDDAAVIRNEKPFPMKALWSVTTGPERDVQWTITPKGGTATTLNLAALEGSPTVNVPNLAVCAPLILATLTVTALKTSGEALADQKSINLQARCPLRSVRIDDGDYPLGAKPTNPVTIRLRVFVAADDPTLVNLTVDGGKTVSPVSAKGDATINFTVKTLGEYSGVLTATAGEITKKIPFSVTVSLKPKGPTDPDDDNLPPICRIKPYLPNCNPTK